MVVRKSVQAGTNEKKLRSRLSWPEWCPLLSPFRICDNRRAAWQLINTVIPYCCLWYLMILSIHYSYLLTLIIALPATAFLVRIFILFHDCVHGSFFSSKRANTFFGYLLGVLVFTSFEDWRFSHLRHHVTYANLDARGIGDIWTMTRTEYESSPKMQQLFYRLYRNPAVLFALGALFNFLLSNRVSTRRVRRRERMSVLLTNLLLLAVILVAAQLIGWQTYLLIQFPLLCLAGAAGIWLFYVQHQFHGVYWARKDHWDPLRAAMEGSSYYALPAVLRWFSGNIGYHHVHHLNPRIPNYHLKKCFDTIPELQAKVPLTITKSFSCVRLKMWDEVQQKMIAFH